MSRRQGILIGLVLLLLVILILRNNWTVFQESRKYSSFPNDGPFPKTDFSLASNKTGLDFWDSTKPSFTCNATTRVGSRGSGGKWVCGLLALARQSKSGNYSCIVYSVGVLDGSSFEADILRLTKCEIYAYDRFANKLGPNVKGNDSRVHFKTVGIAGDIASSDLMTLKEMMDENGHSWIDILKLDVHGAEYDAMDQVFEDFEEELPFGQLLIELHARGDGWEQRNIQIVELLSTLQEKGFRIFSVEPKATFGDKCAEYSLINVNSLELFGQEKKIKQLMQS